MNHLADTINSRGRNYQLTCEAFFNKVNDDECYIAYAIDDDLIEHKIKWEIKDEYLDKTGHLIAQDQIEEDQLCDWGDYTVEKIGVIRR